jgi:hypothetical protein
MAKNLKLLEHIMKHLERHRILTSLNHGSRSGYSCETQLLVTLHDFMDCKPMLPSVQRLGIIWNRSCINLYVLQFRFINQTPINITTLIVTPWLTKIAIIEYFYGIVAMNHERENYFHYLKSLTVNVCYRNRVRWQMATSVCSPWSRGVWLIVQPENCENRNGTGISKEMVGWIRF